MRVKLTNPDTAAGLIDPQTKRCPFLDAEDKPQLEADVPETNFWVRRILDGDLTRLDEPTGSEPITPLTNRQARR